MKSSDVVEGYANLKWDELGFCLIPVDYMYVMKCSKEKNFSDGILTRFGRLEMNPSSGILNYGQVSVINQMINKQTLKWTYISFERNQ